MWAPDGVEISAGAPPTKRSTPSYLTPMRRYIGLDVHQTSTTFAVIGENGKRLGTHVVETNGHALVEQLETIPGKRHVCLCPRAGEPPWGSC